MRTALLLGAAPVVSLLLIWLLLPEHWAHRRYVPGWETALDVVMLVSIGLIETFRVINVLSNAHATLVAARPGPGPARAGHPGGVPDQLRLPGKEPLEMVRATLRGAMRLRHDGPLDVWLLDEGDVPEVRRLCAELEVRHFSRRGVEKWNQPTGPFRARTKHGNYNSWLSEHGEDYGLLVGAVAWIPPQKGEPAAVPGSSSGNGQRSTSGDGPGGEQPLNPEQCGGDTGGRRMANRQAHRYSPSSFLDGSSLIPPISLPDSHMAIYQA